MFRLIIVDDDEILLQGLTEGIDWKKRGIEVVAALNDGVCVAEKVKECQADFLLMDIKMSQMSGLEVLEQLHTEDPDLPVIMLSAYENFSYAQAALKHGAMDYLVKPLSLEQLDEAVQKVTDYLNKKKESAAIAEKLEYSYKNEQELSEIRNVSLKREDLDNLIKLVCLGRVDVLGEYLPKVRSDLEKNGIRSTLVLSYMMSRICSGLAENLDLNEIWPELGEEERNSYFQDMYLKVMGRGKHEEAFREMEKQLLHLAEQVLMVKGSGSLQVISRAYNYVEEHFREDDLRVADVADAVGLTPNYFSKIFVEKTGRTFVEYLTERRMKEAQMLLLYSTYSVQEIAELCGYGSPSYFSNLFKKYTGITVSQFKKNMRKA